MKKIALAIAILAMASVASAQMNFTGSLPSADIPYALDWVVNAEYLQRCYQPVDEGGLGFNKTTLAGKKQCLGAYLSWAWKQSMDAYIANKDVDVAAATAKESAHKTKPSVTVQ